MSWFLGGFTPLRMGWLAPDAVYVDFQTQQPAAWLYQLYAGRTRIGTTLSPSARRLVGQLISDEGPVTLTMIRVDAANRLTDYGPELPPVPAHRYALTWSADDYPADARSFEIAAATEPGGDVDPDNILAQVPCYGDGAYRFELPPLQQGGSWKYRITPRDNATPIGNAGDAEELTITALLPPNDLVQDEATGLRFTPEFAAGVLTVGFVYPEA